MFTSKNSSKMFRLLLLPLLIVDSTCSCSFEQRRLNCSTVDRVNFTVLPKMIWDDVDFSSRNLRMFDVEQLKSLQMRRFNLQLNSLTFIADRTFDSLGEFLVELDLSSNLLAHFSSTWFNVKMSNLKIFNLASNRLESFIDVDHFRFPSLQYLNLSHNQLNSFPQVIGQWSSLISLDFSFNRLSTISRSSLINLQNLTWLSFAGNVNLSCFSRDSFKHLKSLQTLDFSQTNLIDFDACLFPRLSSLKFLRLENLPVNCSSCWISIARTHRFQLIGQCQIDDRRQQFDFLTDQQLKTVCHQSSIDCSIDTCEMSSNLFEKSFRSSQSISSETLKILLTIFFSILTLMIVVFLLISFIRWKQGKKVFCCHLFRRRREQQKEIVDHNPAVIESVVTHGGNMNIRPISSHQNNAFSHEPTSNTKRKLYNPMFADSPSLDEASENL